MKFGNLCRDGADRTRCGGDENGVAVFQRGDFCQADVSSHPGKAEHAEIGAGGRFVGIDGDDSLAVGDPIVAPSGVAENPGPFGKIIVFRLGHHPNAAAFHCFAERERWHVAFGILHAAPHVGIDG